MQPLRCEHSLGVVRGGYLGCPKPGSAVLFDFAGVFVRARKSTASSFANKSSIVSGSSVSILFLKVLTLARYHAQAPWLALRQETQGFQG